ncbi:MAG: DNA cytosine methyltransferase, partial [Pirellulaceae bacterium]|nr:DNA cytosine methyltransferase [Pirellulaceae bacterium]
IDLCAGPGGLGEGFSMCAAGGARFRIALSVEMDLKAHETLELRSFYRQFAKGRVSEDYYRCLRSEIDRSELFRRHPEKSQCAKFEACRSTLGDLDGDREVAKRIVALTEEVDLSRSVLIGGPPCQAYSLAGRSRLAKARRSGAYREVDDGRHTLYQQYLTILKRVNPAVFIMENVRGLLSAKYQETGIFDRILGDLEGVGYDLLALGGREPRSSGLEPADFLIHAHDYGVPQQRDRVFVIGFRRDLDVVTSDRLARSRHRVTVADAIQDLPKLRSGLSRCRDSEDAWKNEIGAARDRVVGALGKADVDVADLVISAAEEAIGRRRLRRGDEFIVKANLRKPRKIAGEFHDWVRDARLGGVCNHSSRGHMKSDLARYLFAASWANVNDVSPTMRDFPRQLLPNHANVLEASRLGSLSSVAFSDRFRVQVAHSPATTVTSHISKDGHYFVHYDPAQCRSLTVREAARLQSFPDNYFFCGGRTDQYRQVGNAVPPLLAKQIASFVMAAIC